MRLSTGSPSAPGSRGARAKPPPLPPVSERRHALSRSFYAGDVIEVARACLGKVLVTQSPQGVTAGIIVETEAYRGPEDLAAHSAGGRRTPRTEAMFGPPGYAYVFFVYGMHFQFNLVTGSPDEPHAVLIRAVEPLVGQELMSVRRGIDATKRDLSNGPGKLCQALGIDRTHYGADLCSGDRVFLVEGSVPAKIGRSPRIGVDYAGKWAARPWRFFDAGSRYVSVARGAGEIRQEEAILKQEKSGPLAGKRITLGVTGSIAAYKAVIVARLLVKEGALVRVVLTAGAARFVGAPTFAGITGKPALTDMFDDGSAVGGELHVALAAESDLVIVVPATADVLSRFASGRADDLLTATVLCARCPVLVAPAMHPSMWTHPATARSVATLTADDRVTFVGPVHGEVASGDLGEGRMIEPEDIVLRAASRLSSFDASASTGALAGRHVVVTAGPTVEDIDPVRFVGNRSSGKMGFALAELAAKRGARVTLIAGPVTLPTPPRVTRVDVRSALDMRAALQSALGADLARADALLMCAAVSDYRPQTVRDHKMKRGRVSTLSLDLVQNPDILAEIGAARRGTHPVLVGFAVETGTDAEITAFARGKLRTKGVDVVVANHAAESMGRDDNRVLLVTETGVDTPPRLAKPAVAARILDWLGTRLSSAQNVAKPRSKKTKPRTKAKR